MVEHLRAAAHVRTEVGVRGYDLRDGMHYLRAERSDFPDKVRLLAADPALRRRLAMDARAIAERQLDWRVLGRKYREALRQLTGLAWPPGLAGALASITAVIAP